MLRLLAAFLNFFLLSIICLRLPEKDTGLASFTTKSDALGSPRSATSFFNKLTACSIILDFGIAIRLNLLKN